ncbi:hypothetical protein GQ457_13G015810 [Hibiscus cannabinus]
MSDATIQNDDREENSDQVQQNLIRDLDRFLRIQLETMEERLGHLEERSEQGSSHGSRRPRVPLRQNQDDYYSQTEGGSDQGSNFNVRRQAPRNQGPRNRNRVDDNLNSIRMAIPLFQGKTDPEAYLEWEKKVELVFEFHNYSENKKVKLAAIEFSDYAIIWWDQLTFSRRRNGERPVSTWDEVKALMRKRFVPTHYHRDLFQRLQSLTQGNRSVEDYYKDMEISMIRANVEEDREAIMASIGALEDNLKKTTKDAPIPAYTWTFEPAVPACGRTPLVAEMLQHTGVQNRQSAEKTKQPRYFAAHMALLQELSPT